MEIHRGMKLIRDTSAISSAELSSNLPLIRSHFSSDPRFKCLRNLRGDMHGIHDFSPVIRANSGRVPLFFKGLMKKSELIKKKSSLWYFRISTNRIEMEVQK